MSLRFQLDEHIPRAVASQLQRRGVDIVTAEMSGLLNTPDRVILDHARANGRVVVTFDSDYTSLHSRGIAHAGIAYFPNAPGDIGIIVTSLLLLEEIFEPNDFENWLEYL